MAKPNYSFEKRQREIAKKKKVAEKDAKKRAQREAAKNGDAPKAGSNWWRSKASSSNKELQPRRFRVIVRARTNASPGRGRSTHRGFVHRLGAMLPRSRRPGG